MKDDHKEKEKNILVLSGRVEGVPKLGETRDRRAVCDARLFIPNGPYRSFKIVASVFDDLAYTRVAELVKGMEVLFVGHLRGFRTWQDEAGRWQKSWFSGTGDIFPVAGLPDLSGWPPDPLSARSAGVSHSDAPSPGRAAEVTALAPAQPGARPSIATRQLDLAGSRCGRYGDPCS